MGRFIVLVLDSFGIGEMEDVKTTRPQDIGANTYKSVISKNEKNTKFSCAVSIVDCSGWKYVGRRFL